VDKHFGEISYLHVFTFFFFFGGNVFTVYGLYSWVFFFFFLWDVESITYIYFCRLHKIVVSLRISWINY
jgi:hypothetical protein